MSGVIWSKFFWSDWMSDMGLRRCSLAAKGLWMDLLCIAAQADPVGYVSINGQRLNNEDIAQVIHEDIHEVNLLLMQLEKNGVFSRCENTGAIYSRRMISDAKKHADYVRRGSAGGNPNLTGKGKKPRKINKKSTNGTEVNLEVKPEVKREVKTEDITHKPLANSHKPDPESLPGEISNPTNTTFLGRDLGGIRGEVEASNSTSGQRDEWQELAIGIQVAFDRAGNMRRPNPWDFVPGWKTDGYAPKMILGVIEAGLRSNPTVKSLGYFANQLAEKHVEVSAVAAKKQQQATIDWDEELDRWEKSNGMVWCVGSRPTASCTQVPLDVLKRRGYRDPAGKLWATVDQIGHYRVPITPEQIVALKARAKAHDDQRRAQDEKRNKALN